MNTKALTLSITASLAVLSPTLTITALAQPAFTPIRLSDGRYGTVWSLSRDGRAAGGESYKNSGSEPGSFRWTTSTGLEEFLRAGDGSIGSGISADGSTVVGTIFSRSTGATTTPYRRLADGTVQSLGHLPNFPDVGSAQAANADGSVIVGYAERFGIPSFASPFRWTSSGGIQPLAGLPAGDYSKAYDVSDDGKTVVGTYDANSLGSPTRAFVWREGADTTFLTGPTGVDGGGARAVSADGSIVAGFAPGLGGSRWVNGIAEGLGLVGDWREAAPLSISDDGSVIVGQLADSPTHVSFGSFVWTKATGMMESIDFLKLMGVPLPSDLNAIRVRCVSGNGLNFGGEFGAGIVDGGGFIAAIPAPSVSSFGLAVGVLAATRRRR